MTVAVTWHAGNKSVLVLYVPTQVLCMIYNVGMSVCLCVCYPAGEGQQEGEEGGSRRLGLAEEDADAEVHEGRGEVHGTLAVRCYRQIRDRELDVLCTKMYTSKMYINKH